MNMHADQIEIELDTVRRLIDQQFPHWADLPLQPVAGAGTVNALFRLGEHLSVRLPLQGVEDLEQQLRLEAAATAEVAEVSPVASPRPVALGRGDGDYPLPWSVRTWVEGEVATPSVLAHSATFADDLTSLIRSLRQAPVNGRTFSGRGRGGHFTDHQEWVQLCLDKSTDLLDVDQLGRLWNSICSLPEEPRLAMCHGDLIPANLLIDGDRLVGVIDCGGFGPADPALDLVAGWHLLDSQVRERMRIGLDCSDLEWARGQGWALQQALGLVWYYRESNPPMAELGRCTIGRILETPVA